MKYLLTLIVGIIVGMVIFILFESLPIGLRIIFSVFLTFVTIGLGIESAVAEDKLKRETFMQPGGI
jgi:uncharacterized protein YqhQ